MTEQEWENCDHPEVMLRFGPLLRSPCCGTLWKDLQDGYVSLAEGQSAKPCCDNRPCQYEELMNERKLRLFACASVRLRWDLLDHPDSRAAVETAEAYADGGITPEALHMASEAAELALPFCQDRRLARAAMWAASRPRSTELILVNLGSCLTRQEMATSAELLRQIVGNPFRRESPLWRRRTPGGPTLLVGEDSRWLTPQVLDLAQAAYQQRHADTGHLDETQLAILCDALEEAGIPSIPILLCDADAAGRPPGYGCHQHGGYAGQVLHGVLHETDPRRPHHHHDEKCYRGFLPHPLLLLLRSVRPLVRGNWMLDHLLGKDV